MRLNPDTEVVRLTPIQGNKTVHLPAPDGTPLCRYDSRRPQLTNKKPYRPSTWAAVEGHFALCMECEEML